MQTQKILIYQIFTRLFANPNPRTTPNGSIVENGCSKFESITPTALKEIHRMGITHIWYTGIIAHATQTDYTAFGIPLDHPKVVKGKAGSPYAIKDYYDVDPDLAIDIDNRMHEFESLVQRTHECGMQVIIDFVPNHVARQYHSLQKPEDVADLGQNDDPSRAFSPQNNFYYMPGEDLGGEIDYYDEALGRYTEHPAKATGNDRFDAHPNRNDWYETIKLNYGVDYAGQTGNHFTPIPDTWHKMKDILLFWASKGIDGFRCDMAEMVPCDFWAWAIREVKAQYPDLIFIAEVYNPQQYRNYIHHGGFDLLYDKVGLYDTLRAVTCGYGSATQITWCWQAVNDIQPHMLNFLENHDEQRIASDFFAGNPFKAIPALVVAACLNTNPMMIYFGQELGEMGMDEEGFSGRDGRTTIFDYWSIETMRRWWNEGKYDEQALTEQERLLCAKYRRILTLARHEKALSAGVLFDLMYVNCNGWLMNENKQFAFIRKYADELIFIVVNFDEIPVNISVNLPQHAFDFLQMEVAEKIEATDLLSDDTFTLPFTPHKPVPVSLDAFGARMLKYHIQTKTN